MQIYVSSEREQKLRNYCQKNNLAISKVVGELIDTVAESDVRVVRSLKEAITPKVKQQVKEFVKERGELRGDDYV